MARRQEAPRTGIQYRVRPPRIIAFGSDKYRSPRRRSRQQRYVGEVDMRAGRPTEENDVELLSLLHETRKVAGGRYIRNPPAPRLVRERQFETVAMQSTLIDDREMTPNWADIDARWKTRFFSDELIEHGRRPLYENRVSLSLACKRMTPC
jgi:hypothetical protein